MNFLVNPIDHPLEMFYFETDDTIQPLDVSYRQEMTLHERLPLPAENASEESLRTQELGPYHIHRCSGMSVLFLNGDIGHIV